eukprot:1876703-Alexandrium_andersonii.AAC.1
MVRSRRSGPAARADDGTIVDAQHLCVGVRQSPEVSANRPVLRRVLAAMEQHHLHTSLMQLPEPDLLVPGHAVGRLGSIGPEADPHAFP